VYVVFALHAERFAMLGHLVHNSGAYRQNAYSTPLLPAFLRRALAALFRRH
jgi:hypothetical protein